MYDLSIIIATKNEQNYIADTLSYLRASMKAAEKQGIKTELIVVDSSAENTATIARRFTCNVHCLPPNGVSAARNYGAAKSSGNLLVFMDADTMVQKSTLTDVYNVFQNKGAVAAISFVVPAWHDKLSASAKLFYVLDCAFIKACALFPLLISFYNRGDIIAIKRSSFNQIKGFNEALYMMEITELLGKSSKLGKIKVLSSPVFESSRRLKQWGLLKSYQIWWRNYFDFYLLKRLHDSSYEAIR